MMSSGVTLAATVNDQLRPVAGMPPRRTGAAEHLREIVEQIETFLLEQIERLERTLGNGEPLERAGEAWARQANDVAEERRNWELQRERELEQLRSEANRLMDAWQRLESEQRKLLNRGEVVPSQQVANREDARYARTLPNPRTCSEKATGLTGIRASDEEPLTAECAALQFQQMRREIQRHRLRR